MGDDDEASAGQGDRPLVLDSYGRLSKVPDTGELPASHDTNSSPRALMSFTSRVPSADVRLVIRQCLAQSGHRRGLSDACLSRVAVAVAPGLKPPRSPRCRVPRTRHPPPLDRVQPVLGTQPE